MNTEDIKEAAAALGRKGGKAKSDAKAQAARKNGAKGGRPRKPRLYDYRTGEEIRTMTDDEMRRYLDLSDGGTCAGGTGVVDGEEFGEAGRTVYAQQIGTAKGSQPAETYHPSFRPTPSYDCQCRGCGETIRWSSRIDTGGVYRLEDARGKRVGIEEDDEIYCLDCYENL